MLLLKNIKIHAHQLLLMLEAMVFNQVEMHFKMEMNNFLMQESLIKLNMSFIKLFKKLK